MGAGPRARRYAREVIEIEVPYDSAVPAVSVTFTVSNYTLASS